MAKNKQIKVNITFSQEVISEEERVQKLAEFFYLLWEIDQKNKLKGGKSILDKDESDN